METVICDLCEQTVDKKDCIKLKSNEGTQTCCKVCVPEYAEEIEHFKNNAKLKLANIPVKKVS